AAELFVQVLPQVDTGLGQRVFLGVVRRHHQVPHATTRCRPGNRATIAQHDARRRVEQLRQVVDDGAANDAASYDDDVRGFAHEVGGSDDAVSAAQRNVDSHASSPKVGTQAIANRFVGDGSFAPSRLGRLALL